MRTVRTHKLPRGSALAPLFAAVLLLPRLAFAEDADARRLFDSSSERSPAVTAFPKYPSIARRDRIEGETVVCFTIDARGRIIRPSVRSSTHRIFEKPAMKAIRDSSFAPLAEGEEPASAKTCRTYRFRLDPLNARTDSSVSDPEQLPGGARSSVSASLLNEQADREAGE
jgi:TonB family protein